MEAQRVNRFTLLPGRPAMKGYVKRHSASKVQLLFINVVIFVAVSLIFNIVLLIKDLCTSDPYKKSLGFVLIDIGRILYYLGVFCMSRISHLTQSILISTFPLLYSVLVTELLIYNKREDMVLIRVLSASSIFLVMAQHTLYSFVFTMIPYFISYAYPFIRIAVNDYSTNLLLPMINGIFSNIMCAYFLRKSAVEDLCSLFISKTMNKQWIQIMNMLSSGELILSSALPPRVLYYNAAFEELVKKLLAHGENTAIINMAKIVEGLTIKGINTSGDDVKTEFREKLTEFIRSSGERNFKDCNCFLDSSEFVIKININKLIFNGEEANIVSFIDCSSASEIEKFQTECKYKTILISSISHELRTPVNYILNALDLVSSFLPSDSMNLLEMSKECCNMIIAHINDLTVRLRVSVGLRETVRGKAADCDSAVCRSDHCELVYPYGEVHDRTERTLPQFRTGKKNHVSSKLLPIGMHLQIREE
eukprot:TRINITY_DN4833_c0_g1_i12.p1 TRINITY_DN4833_c0_g1~~TRINITY_DN4833_c0_g1_i12.p1  ORF type:complete len:478 (+),score=59.56 TRINITY_DN4833_c0_g1_i12:301-1734(+)